MNNRPSSKNEIIFNRSNNNIQGSGGGGIDEDVDLEIILLGPKKVQAKDDIAKRFRQKIRSKTSSDSSIDSIGSSETILSQSEEPGLNTPVANDDDKGSKANISGFASQEESNDAEKTDDGSKTLPISSPSTAPNNSDQMGSNNTLDRMERRFKGRESSGRPKAEDRLRIDYMDYF